MKGFWLEGKMCYSPLTQAAPGMELHLSRPRKYRTEVPEGDLGRSHGMTLWEESCLAHQDAFCGQRPSSSPSCPTPCIPPACGFLLKQQRARVGWGRIRTGVNYKATFLLCCESCLFNILATQIRKVLPIFYIFIFLITDKCLYFSLGAWPHPYLSIPPLCIS